MFVNVATLRETVSAVVVKLSVTLILLQFYAIEFARWQHRAVGRAARLAVSAITYADPPKEPDMRWMPSSVRRPSCAHISKTKQNSSYWNVISKLA